MPLLNATIEDKEVQKRYRFKESLLNEVEQYCKWANIASDNHFFEECAEYLLSKDRDWQQHKKTKAESATVEPVTQTREHETD